MASLILRNRFPARNGRSWGALDEFENLVERFFNSYGTLGENEQTARMQIELTEKENNFVLKAVLPGLNKEDINIEVSEEYVIISGEYKNQYEENNELIHRSEFYSGRFERKISMPQKINHQKVKAEYQNGILTLTIPKSEKEINKLVKISL